MRNSLIRKKLSCEVSVVKRVECNVLKWPSMKEEILVKSEYSASVDSNKGRGRLRKRRKNEELELLMRNELSDKIE